MAFDFGFFDFDGDGNVSFDEEVVGMAILDDVLSEDEDDFADDDFDEEF